MALVLTSRWALASSRRQTVGVELLDELDQLVDSLFDGVSSHLSPESGCWMPVR